MMEFIYRTDFHLTNSVKDYREAKAYLEEETHLAEYFNRYDAKRAGGNLIDVVTKIMFYLDNEYQGHVEVRANRQLMPKELYIISEYISGQASDGLGEGFEQQPFANYPPDDYNSPFNGYDEYDEDEEWIMCSFDWETNEYVLEFVGQE